MRPDPAITPAEDAVRYWNAVMLECNRRDHTPRHSAGDQRGPTRTSRAFAIVARAVDHAVQTPPAGPVASRPSYPPAPAAPAGTSPDDAAAGAAFEALVALYPQQADWIAEQLARRPVGNTTSFNYGRAVALVHLEARANDGSEAPGSYTYLNTPGDHRPDPVQPDQEALSPHWGQVTLIDSGPLITLLPPPGYGGAPGARINRADPTYSAAVNDVRTLGHRHRTMTTPPGDPESSMIGIFWGYDGANELGTPPRLYYQVVLAIIGELPVPLTMIEAARLFAAISAAMADAGIHAWYNKYLYNLWRPTPGIRAHADSGPPGPCDPFWLPVGAPDTNGTKKYISPGFPAYPSGHATFGAAALYTAQLILHDLRPGTFPSEDVASGPGFAFESNEFNGENRDADGIVRPRYVRAFASIWDAIVENGESRVYLGVHWRFDSHPFNPGNPTARPDPATITAPANQIGGIPLGLAIAARIRGNYA